MRISIQSRYLLLKEDPRSFAFEIFGHHVASHFIKSINMCCNQLEKGTCVAINTCLESSFNNFSCTMCLYGGWHLRMIPCSLLFRLVYKSTRSTWTHANMMVMYF
jgi:hypothetical protein